MARRYRCGRRGSERLIHLLLQVAECLLQIVHPAEQRFVAFALGGTECRQRLKGGRDLIVKKVDRRDSSAARSAPVSSLRFGLHLLVVGIQDLPALTEGKERAEHRGGAGDHTGHIRDGGAAPSPRGRWRVRRRPRPRPASAASRAFAKHSRELFLHAFAGDALDERELNRLQQLPPLPREIRELLARGALSLRKRTALSITSCNCGQSDRRSVSSSWTAFSTCGWTVCAEFRLDVVLKIVLPFRATPDQPPGLARTRASPRATSCRVPRDSRQACSIPRMKPATCRRVGSLRASRNIVSRARCCSSRTMVSKLPCTSSATSPQDQSRRARGRLQLKHAARRFR